MIELYHGSNVLIDNIDLSRSRKGKDFGCGFYLNPDKKQAFEMAVRTSQRMMNGKPIVNTFIFDDSILTQTNSSLNIKIFDGYSIEWAEFILKNRRNLNSIPIHPYDIVIGPIANDTVGLQLQRFIQGYISIEHMIDNLKFNKPAVQYYFGTKSAIELLKRI